LPIPDGDGGIFYFAYGMPIAAQRKYFSYHIDIAGITHSHKRE